MTILPLITHKMPQPLIINVTIKRFVEFTETIKFHITTAALGFKVLPPCGLATTGYQPLHSDVHAQLLQRHSIVPLGSCRNYPLQSRALITETKQQQWNRQCMGKSLHERPKRVDLFNSVWLSLVILDTSNMEISDIGLVWQITCSTIRGSIDQNTKCSTTYSITCYQTRYLC